MAAPAPSGGAGGGKDAPARPIGPDGKPIPGPAEVRQIQAARKMAQQQAQVCKLSMFVNVLGIINLSFRWMK